MLLVGLPYTVRVATIQLLICEDKTDEIVAFYLVVPGKSDICFLVNRVTNSKGDLKNYSSIDFKIQLQNCAQV